MDSTSLFTENAAAVPIAPPPLAEQVNAMINSVNAEPLPETVLAMLHIPETVRPVVELLAAEIYQEQFRKLATQVVSERAAMNESASTRVDPARTPAMLAQTAKLHVLSAVGHLSAHPWHVADSKTLRTIATDLERSGDFSYARGHLMALRPVNLFVAAAPDDDRDSYLKAVSAAVKGRRVCYVVLDAELIEWHPDADFQAACSQVGLRPRFVGITERSKVGQHQMLFPIGRADPLDTVVIDTAGRELVLDSQGAIARPAPAASPEVRVPAGGKQEQAVPPPASVKAKIAALRDQQRHRASRRP